MQNTLLVLLKEPHQPAEVRTMTEKEFTEFYEAKPTKTLNLASDVALICRRDAEFDNTPFNCRICNLQIFGTAIICGREDKKFTSIPAADILRVRDLFFGRDIYVLATE